MASYSRPAREVYRLNFPGTTQIRFWKYQEIRYVSKPLRSSVLPHKVWGGRVEPVAKGELVTLPYAYANLNNSWALLRCRHGDQAMAAPAAAALQKAYARYLDKVNSELETSEWAVGLAERGQAAKMMRTRLEKSVNQIYSSSMTLAAAYRSLRRGDFGRFLSILGLKRLPKRLQGKVKTPRGRWSAPEAASGLWLEYWFGWSPLIADIHSAVSILEAEFPQKVRIYASATGRSVLDGYVFASAQRFTGELKAKVRLGADIEVTNPNLRRATLLGLTNPAAVAWELIPFSFLVDWFIPVSNFLNSWSDHFGLTVTDSYTARKLTVRGEHMVNYVVSNGRSFVTNDYSTYCYHRTAGIANPPLYPKTIKGLSVTRAATSVALLLQVFKPSKTLL